MTRNIPSRFVLLNKSVVTRLLYQSVKDLSRVKGKIFQKASKYVR